MTRERLEAAYEYLLEHPPLGLSVQRRGDELFLVTAPEVAPAIERHLGNPRPVQLSQAAREVLAIVAYKQPIAWAGIERIRGTNSGSALDTLLTRELVALDDARLFRTTRAFLEFASLRDLADLPPLCATTRRLRIYGQREPVAGARVTASVTPRKVVFSLSTSSPTTPCAQ